MNTKPIIVFLILILLSGTTLANESMNRNSKFDSYLRECNDSYFSPYAEIIPRLLIIEKESLANFTNPESPIYDPGVVKVYGNIPKIETHSQLMEHVSTLRRIRDDSTNEMIPILYPKGPVVQYGANTIQRGYIVIELYDGDEHKTSYSESEFYEIYDILRKNAIKVGIDDYPVIFVLTNNTQLIGSLDMHAWYESDDHVFYLDDVYTPEYTIKELLYVIDQNVSDKVNHIKGYDKMGEFIIEPLIQGLKDNNPDVREIAAQILGKRRDEKAVEPLIELLEDEQLKVQKAAQDALSNIGEPALDPLIAYINDQNKSIHSREQAIFALGGIGEPAVESLIQLLAESATGFDGFAASALNDIGKPAVEPLIRTLEDDNPYVRAHAASILGGMRDERAIKPLTEALNDEDERVRTFAKTSLERIANQNKYGVIATYGKEREFYIEDERREWLENIGGIMPGVRDNISLYYYPEGPVIVCGCNYRGYIDVSFLEGSEINESLMHEIYGIFDKQGRQMGIHEVPVLFQFSEMVKEDEGSFQIPGFTVITLLMVFLGILLRKQK